MAKRRHEEVQTESSKTALVIMAVGALAVAALVVWALTRTVQPVPSSTTASVPMGAEQPATSTAPTPATPNPAFPPVDTATTATGSASNTLPATSTYTPNPPTADESSSVPRIELADLKAKIDGKAVTLIDVRQDTAYMTAHIPGAMHIPMATVESQISSIPKDKPIVTYCT